MITQDQLKEILHYCPETGVFTWLGNRRSVKKGAIAGCVWTSHEGKRYIHIRVYGRTTLAHRLAMLYMTGEFPEHEVDHQDGNGCNNVWSNLREVTRSENMQNMRKTSANTSGVTGVVWDRKNKKWRAQIGYRSCNYPLGRFHDKEEAIAARKAAEVFYNFHENHGTERPL
jgi:hypothetical protein